TGKRVSRRPALLDELLGLSRRPCTRPEPLPALRNDGRNTAPLESGGSHRSPVFFSRSAPAGRLLTLSCSPSFWKHSRMSFAGIRNNPHFEPMGIYASGFLDSAAALFARADRGEGLVDFAFYPAAYCLRHGLELFIKQMTICVAYELHDETLLYDPG